MTEANEAAIEYAFRNITFEKNSCERLDSCFNGDFIEILEKIGEYEIIYELKIEHPFKELYMSLVTLHKTPIDLQVTASNNYAYVFGDKKYVDKLVKKLDKQYSIKISDMPNYCF